MTWFDDPNHPFTGIAEKLKRTEENIVYLNAEIGKFIDDGKYPPFPNDNDEAFQEAAKAHFAREIPIRFCVLAGEIVHHLRSCLDHVVWLLSSDQYRIDSTGAIEFPIFKEKPISEKELSRFNRKIKGVTSTYARTTIHSFQPYKALERGETPESDLLWIVHDLDRIDKHRELVIVISSINMRLDAQAVYKFIVLKEKANPTNADFVAFERDVQVNTKFSPQISFGQFGDRENQPVIPGLFELLNYVKGLVGIFAAKLK